MAAVVKHTEINVETKGNLNVVTAPKGRDIFMSGWNAGALALVQKSLYELMDVDLKLAAMENTISTQQELLRKSATISAGDAAKNSTQEEAKGIRASAISMFASGATKVATSAGAMGFNAYIGKQYAGTSDKLEKAGVIRDALHEQDASLSTSTSRGLGDAEALEPNVGDVTRANQFKRGNYSEAKLERDENASTLFSKKQTLDAGSKAAIKRLNNDDANAEGEGGSLSKALEKSDREHKVLSDRYTQYTSRQNQSHTVAQMFSGFGDSFSQGSGQTVQASHKMVQAEAQKKQGISQSVNQQAASGADQGSRKANEDLQLAAKQIDLMAQLSRTALNV